MTDSNTAAAIEPLTASTAVLPDRLCVDPKSPFFNEEVFKQNIGIRFNGIEKSNVEEYCISEGWIRIAASKSLDRKGRPLLMKFKGKVEAFIKDPE
jgi:predicted house-cleaning NTP pyrophosphatase (Maf/HAM1 superfamily)